MKGKYVAGMVLAASMLGAGLAAADDTAALRQQVQQLNTRVAQLEQQLQKTQAPAQMPAPQAPAYTSGLDMWDPFMEMDSMQRAVNRMFAESWGQPGMQGAFFNPRADIKQDAKQYTITMDVPGMDKNKIDVKVENNNLIVSGERNSETTQDQKGKPYMQQRSYGQFMRVVPLPDDAKTGSVDAQYNNGVLTIKVARGKEAKPAVQKITVK